MLAQRDSMTRAAERITWPTRNPAVPPRDDGTSALRGGAGDAAGPVAGLPGGRSASGPDRWTSHGFPALLVLLGGLGLVLLRGPLPVDETRYLEIFREMDGRFGLFLHLGGEAYGDKTPLLFWLGALAHGCGLPLEAALRIWPPVFAAGTVLATAELGRRVGARSAGWLLATALLPFLYAQVLYFDTLVAFGVTASLLAWTRGRAGRAGAWGGFAVLAKGPIALLYLVPLWLGLRAPGLRPRARTVAATLALSLLPLAAWFSATLVAGSVSFRHELLVEQTLRRATGATGHARPLWFYLPLLPLVLFPWSAAAFVRPRGARGTERAALLAVAASVALLSVVGSKQPAYLLPLCPVLAVLAARRLELHPAGARLRHRLVGLALGLALVLLAAQLGGAGYLRATYGPNGAAYLGSVTRPMSLGLGGVALVWALGTWWSRRGAVRDFVAAFVGLGAALLPLHVAAGWLLVPRAFARFAAAHPDAPLATYRSAQSGYVNWLAARDVVPDLTEAELAPWIGTHPGGYLWVKETYQGDLRPFHLDLVLADQSRSHRVLLLQVPEEHHAQ